MTEKEIKPLSPVTCPTDVLWLQLLLTIPTHLRIFRMREHLKTTHCFTSQAGISLLSLFACKPVRSLGNQIQILLSFLAVSLPLRFVLPWRYDNNNQQVRKAMSEVEQAPRGPELSSYQPLLSQSHLKMWTLSEEWFQGGLQHLKVEIEMAFSG